MDIGQHVELTEEVLGTPAGTPGIVKTLVSDKPMTIQLYPLQNNAVLEVEENQIKVRQEIQTNGTQTKPIKKRKATKNR